MSEILKRIRSWGLGTIMFELLVFVSAVVLYVFDFPEGFHDIMIIDYWILAGGVLLIINLLLFWISFLRIYRIRQKTDLQAAALIGGDVQEAYNFGQIGLIVTDEKGSILWTSNLFKDRNIEILDDNIFDLYANLRELTTGAVDAKTKIAINNRNYEVKYLQVAKLFIFRDITEYEMVFNYSRDQATVIGIISIDNYNELAGGEEDNNEIFSNLKKEILDYAKDYGVLLRKFRTDSYMAVCNRQSLERMQKDEFSILSKVRAVGKSNDLHPTLSIGFAYDFPDVNKLNEMASNALDIALSRGGDQAVVSKYGDDLTFYGGNTAVIETTSNVKARSLADSIIALINASENVLVMGHKDMDMDSLGACLGVKAICDNLKKSCKVVFDAKLSESKTLAAVNSSFDKDESERTFIRPKNAVDEIKDSTLLIICDVSNPTMVLSDLVLDKASKIIVIDHHRRGESFIEHSVLSYIEPSSSSACEMISLLVKYSSYNPRIEIDSKTATFMLSGMFLDTNFFKAKITGTRTFDAAENLKNFGADNGKADDFLKDEYEEYSLINSIISTMKTPYYGVVYCVSNNDEIIERSMLAKVANQVLQLKGVNACFVIGRTNSSEIRMSCRSDGSINVQLLAEKMGGGGTFTSAASSCVDKTVELVENQLLDVLDEYLNSAKAANTQREE